MTELVSSPKQDRLPLRSHVGGLWPASVLFAAVRHLLPIFVPGSARILQLRMRRYRQAAQQLPVRVVRVSQIRDSLDSHYSTS